MSTFTFTYICHHGKTHNHRSREVTTWRAQTSSGFIKNAGGSRDTHRTINHNLLYVGKLEGKRRLGTY